MTFEEALALSLTSDPDPELRKILDLFHSDESKARELYPKFIPMFEAIVKEEKKKGFR